MGEVVRLPRCSCLDVHGEDPNCVLHGYGTAWRVEHADECDDEEWDDPLPLKDEP